MTGAAAAAGSSAAREWREHWPLVLASTIALSLTTIGVYSMGLFMEPLSREFGWSRAQVTSGLTLFSLVAVPLGPFGGALVDRLGSRRVALPGVALAGAAFALFATMQGSILLWWGAWLLYGLVSMGVKSLVWTAAVANVFHSGRGLAMAVVLCGSALGSTGTPIVANWLIAEHGWRFAYVAIGLGWSAIVLAVLIPCFREARDRAPRHAGAAAPAATPALTGIAVRDAWRDPPLRKLAVALALLSGLLVALIVHFVPILGERGVTRGQAAGIVALFGVVAVPAKLIVGSLIDRLPVGLVAGTIFTLPALTCAILLLAPPTMPVLVIGALILGTASGGYFHLAGYMTSRFAGLRNFGKIYGFMTSVMALATGVSPVLAGWVFDRGGSYDAVLIAGLPIAIGCGLLMATIGRFPDWTAAPATA